MRKYRISPYGYREHLRWAVEQKLLFFWFVVARFSQYENAVDCLGKLRDLEELGND